MHSLYISFLGFLGFFFLQPGELPIPRDAKENEKFGNYTFGDFISDNYLYILGILLIIALLVFYAKEKKRQDGKEKMN